METNLSNRIQAILLALATVGLVLLAVLNFRQEIRFEQPDDGVWWREISGGIEAIKVLPDSPGQRAGIQPHDLLTGAHVLPTTPGLRPQIQAEDLLPEDQRNPNRPASKKNRDLLSGVNPIPDNLAPGARPNRFAPEIADTPIVHVS